MSSSTIEIDPNSPVSLRAAARVLNRSDVALLQHEYGIFGRDDGIAVLDLMRLVDVPTVVVLHTVLRSPSARQRRIVEDIGRSDQVVVLCETARRVLHEDYGIPTKGVGVIHHGCHWVPKPPNPAPHNRLITWGLLGPGKGLERSIESLALLNDMGVEAHYRIVGRTHPEVVRREGFAYRRHLESLVGRLGLGRQVEFIDRYLADDELSRMVSASDLVVVPYDSTEQVSSGVITEALGIGRPVVATRFAYAEEMLSEGAGMAVPHDSTELARSIATLLRDDRLYQEAVVAAARASGGLHWDTVAEKYAGLLQGTVAELASA